MVDVLNLMDGDAAGFDHRMFVTFGNHEFDRGKLEQANKAIADGKNALAGDLAEESLADSHLAQTKAELATMRARVEAQKKENERLRKQLLDRAARQHTVAAPASGLFPVV